MPKIYIYTEDFFLWPRLKSLAKQILGRGFGGPAAVERSLLKGLKELGQEFVLNQPPEDRGGTACVLSGAAALHWAIGQKKFGFFRRLVAGPNISVTPFDFGGLVLAPEIDAYVVPAQWSVDWWSSLRPELSNKLKVWPAGVEDRGLHYNPAGQVLVFQKNAPANLLQAVTGELTKLNLPFQVIYYGKYELGDYINCLSKARLMVYLSQSESQGLALHEAWMSGVPTLVWNEGVLKYKNYEWQDRKISAPYLTTDCGLFFKDAADFPQVLSEALVNFSGFSPRKYSLENFTDALSAKKYYDILENL